MSARVRYEAIWLLPGSCPHLLLILATRAWVGIQAVYSIMTITRYGFTTKCDRKECIINSVRYKLANIPLDQVIA